MRILNNEEILAVYKDSEMSFAADDPFRYGNAVAKAQFNQDVKDFIELLEKGQIESGYSIYYRDIIESLK